MNQSPKSFNPLAPLLYAVLIALGVGLGFLFNGSGIIQKGPDRVHSSNGKIENVLDFIEQNYVDTIKRNDLEEKTLIAMLHNLDPHSEFIPAKDFESVNEPLEGNFEGIGVEFNILDDTIMVTNPVSGGPAEKVGIIAGDRIVKVNDKVIAGTKITNKRVFELLRGKEGTKVKLGVKRSGEKGLIDFVVTRGEIPIYSIDIAYMVSADIGLIKISRFGATTYNEFIRAFNKLSKSGMKKLILDLRGNGGGYLNAAVQIADEFLPKGMRIVYTMGKASPRRDYVATEHGGFENGKLIILVDEGSASASEILAGAMQDNDRAEIVGRRTFGKGLVQEQLQLPDGSALRLTTARYYTPSGRCIQKPYEAGNDAYYNEEFDRYETGELLNKDSIKLKTDKVYHTAGGKKVFAEGGIMPDQFIPIDTSFRTPWLSRIIYTGALSDFAFSYVDKNRVSLRKFNSPIDFGKLFAINESTINELLIYSERDGKKADPAQVKRSSNYLKVQLKALIGRNLFNNDGYYPVIFSNDPAVKKALEVLSK